MPIKFSRDASNQLFKYIHTIDIKFNPFDARTRSIRELIRQVHAPRYKQANPKLKISMDMHNRPDAPQASFHFIDGSVDLFPTENFTINEMLFDIHMKALKMDAEFEMDGKNIDDDA